MKEPYLSEFRQLLQIGAAKQDIHDSKEATGYAVTSPTAKEPFVRNEIERVATHQRCLCPLLEEEVGSVRNILDVGCSTGGTTVALALSTGLAAAEVIGVDPNRLSLQAAEVRARGYDLAPDRVRFLPTSPSAPLEFEDNPFDLTVCVSVLEFISSVDARKAFTKELQRVTRPNGYIFLATPTPYRFREYHSRRWLGDYRRKEGYPWSSSPWQIRNMFTGCTRVPLHRQYYRMAGARLGRLLDWFPAAVISSLAPWATPWQKLLFRKDG